MSKSNHDEITKLIHQVDASAQPLLRRGKRTDHRNVRALQRTAAFKAGAEGSEQSLPWSWRDSDSAAADLGDEAWRFGFVSDDSDAGPGLIEADDAQQLASLEFDRRPHYYSDRAFICNEDADPGCTPEAVFHALRRFAAPGRAFGRPVNDGDKTKILGLGTVVHDVDEANLTVRNDTLDDHVLHPGYVERSVEVEDGDIYVVSEGRGTGNYATLNEDLSGVLWGYFNARRIREAIVGPTPPGLKGYEFD